MEEEILEEEYSAVDEIVSIVRSGKEYGEILEELDNYHENDIASALEFLTVDERKALYRILGVERMSDIFAYLDDVAVYLEELGLEKAADVIEQMDADDAVDVLDEIEDEETRDKIISLMDEEAQDDIELISSYEEDEIGSMMTTNYVAVNKNSTVPEAMSSLISQAGDNDNINTIYAVDENDHYYGAIELRDLIIARRNVPLEDIISTAYPTVGDKESISENLERIKEYSEDSIPVVDEEGKLLGVITSADIVEAVDDEMGDDYAKLAGLTEEEDLNERLTESMRKRLPWLILLFFLGMGVSSVVGLFEATVSQIAILFCFQSLVLGMAGNVGTQSLAVTIRVLMDENITGVEKFKFVFKEVRVGFTNGALLGLSACGLVALYLHFFKDCTWSYGFSVAACVGVALLVSMIVSSLMGTVIPMFFHKLHVDPAVASGPLITTVNDLVAAITYYGLANVLLIQLLHIGQVL